VNRTDRIQLAHARDVAQQAMMSYTATVRYRGRASSTTLERVSVSYTAWRDAEEDVTRLLCPLDESSDPTAREPF
jgi:hypothetical protein